MGFEPTVPFSITGFQDQLLKPLGHLSLFKFDVGIITDPKAGVNARTFWGVANRALEKIYKRKRDFARLVS